MTKLNKRPIRFVAAGLAATLLVGACAISATIRPQADSYTVENNDGYYSQTTYYLTEEAYNEYLDKTSAKTELNSAGATKSAAAAKVNTSPSSGDDGEFVMAAAKTVWVAEEFDENGNVTASELLTKEQMDDYGISPMGLINNKFNQDNLFSGKGGGGSTEISIGEDELTYHTMTMHFKVTYDHIVKTYKATGTAGWTTYRPSPFEYEYATEYFNDDYIGIVWTDGDTLRGQYASASGYYHDNGDAQIFFMEKDPTAGYAWGFKERITILSSPLKNVTASVTLKRTGEPTKTSSKIKFIYIHTYAGASLNFSTSLIDFGLSVNGSDKTWDTYITIPDLKY